MRVRRPKVFIFIGILLSLVLGISSALEVNMDEETVKLTVGETKIISTREPYRVVIGNPEVADVINVTTLEITVSAKSPGLTTLVYWDAFGEQTINIKVIQENMDEIKRRVDNLLEKLNLSEVFSQASDDEGKVILLGRVKGPQEKERIALALGQLKEKTVDLTEIKEEEAIVDIDVQILEIDKDATDTLGFSWPGSITLTEAGSPAIATSAVTQVGTTSTTTGGTAIGTKWSTLFKVLNLSRAAFTFKLDALIQEGKVRVLSRPRLSCQSGKEAELLVGGEKPIFTTAVQATVGTSTNVDYKEFGIKLNIKPTVTEEERIKLALKVEVSEVGEAETIGSTTAPTAKAYPLTKRTATTELYLNDSQTMGIGGLIKQKTEEDLRKMPWLADIPVLGLFFRQKVTKIGGGTGARGDTELFITLTPTIVSKQKTKDKSVSSSKTSVQEEVSLQKTDIPANLVNYIRMVQTKIIKAVYYPPQAKDAGWEGNVKINLNIASNGSLKEIKILQSSGYKILDDAALVVVRNQAPYPPFSPQIDAQEIWIDVPIVYKKN